MYKLVSVTGIFRYLSFTRATNKLVELGNGKLYFGRTLVGEL